MGSAQRGNDIDNIYQNPVSVESPYQTFQLQHPGKNIQKSVGPYSTGRGSRILVIVLCFINTLLLVINLVVLGVHYSKSNADNTHLAGYGQTYLMDNQNGFWHLRDNIFYLFWHGQGDCQEAESFCNKKNATLVTLRKHNRDWMISVANGKQLWVKADIHSFSGQSPDEEACPCELLLASDRFAAADCENVHSWVCEREEYTPTIMIDHPILN
ncbi:uncharacterized protein LOC118235264 isoform X2 [Anguilla anguilla]|uniref:uncharacterized protein LOC118235264 isoform X2 n=1 Tax=Anguilla anguilla TaxID=7936 RepID=UPI0015AA2707|nr:uncharacterized protein LOC118235264 isoform X2 [Anguilla anguilla]